ncbi:MAG: hypothetical protein M1837_005573 [Sclerophora amabilis]|nr:MAG: hypothetical protein M1837_005573 [Sclerophora amabilis]
MTAPSSGTSLSDLPDEVLQSILYCLPPITLLSLHRTSKRLNSLANEPLLWRYICRTEYNHWDPDHNIKEKLAAGIDAANWKELFYQRCRTDNKTSQLLNSLLASQTGRVGKIQEIVTQGYDIKDTLLRNIRTGDEAEDVLARRYYSDVILGHLHRTMAIKAWADVPRGGSASLEHTLGAFDMFVLHDREGDLVDISDRIDDLASSFKDTYPNWPELTPRDRSLALAKYVRASKLTGVDSESRYHDLRNNYIGVALHSKEHSSIPLISVAIYCAIARKIDVDARPCGFPFHVHAIICPPESWTLDNRPRPSHIEPIPMYLDPYRSDVEVPVEHLRTQLLNLGADAMSHADYLSSCSLTEIVLRAGRNIMNSVQESRRSAFGAAEADPNISLEPSPYSFLDIENAFYSAIWASLILGSQNPGANNPDGTGIAAIVRRRQYFPYILQTFQQHFPEDSDLIEQHIAPLTQGEPARDEILETVRLVRVADRAPKIVKSRSDPTLSRPQIRYRVGQFFRHKRYLYTAVITGWDSNCTAPETWMQAQRVDELEGGRQQSFYHVLVEQDQSVRYVAEENIRVLHGVDDVTSGEPAHTPSPTMMHMAGRHFKRWDAATFEFVSNSRDEYPED